MFSHIYRWFSYVFPYLWLIFLSFPMMFPWFFPFKDGLPGDSTTATGGSVANGHADEARWSRQWGDGCLNQSRTLQCDNTYVIICKRIWYIYIYIHIVCILMYISIYTYIHIHTFIDYSRSAVWQLYASWRNQSLWRDFPQFPGRSSPCSTKDLAGKAVAWHRFWKGRFWIRCLTTYQNARCVRDILSYSQLNLERSTWWPF